MLNALFEYPLPRFNPRLSSLIPEEYPLIPIDFYNGCEDF